MSDLGLRRVHAISKNFDLVIVINPQRIRATKHAKQAF